MDSLMEEGRRKEGRKEGERERERERDGRKSTREKVCLFPFLRPSLSLSIVGRVHPSAITAAASGCQTAEAGLPFVGRVLKEVQIQFVSRAADGRTMAPPIDVLWIHHQSKASDVVGGKQGRKGPGKREPGN